MRAIKLNGTVSAIDENQVIPSGATVLDGTVKIVKSGSSSNGLTANIVAVKNEKVVVTLQDKPTEHRTYSFDQLAQA